MAKEEEKHILICSCGQSAIYCEHTIKRISKMNKFNEEQARKEVIEEQHHKHQIDLECARQSAQGNEREKIFKIVRKQYGTHSSHTYTDMVELLKKKEKKYICHNDKCPIRPFVQDREQMCYTNHCDKRMKSPEGEEASLLLFTATVKFI